MGRIWDEKTGTAIGDVIWDLYNVKDVDCQNLMKRMGIEFENIVMRATSIPTKMFTDRSKS